jgi:hypothetical protein
MPKPTHINIIISAEYNTWFHNVGHGILNCEESSPWARDTSSMARSPSLLAFGSYGRRLGLPRQQDRLLRIPLQFSKWNSPLNSLMVEEGRKALNFCRRITSEKSWLSCALGTYLYIVYTFWQRDCGWSTRTGLSASALGWFASK